uniref:ATP synthase subunit a n=1 Tax=Leiochrinini sp. 2 ACP-2013 TaxID=1434620 RepID=A0A3G3FXM5_9CUCU|nr:ATP synthase F0 subunit 6 [Leiochrinini sp. 2 ACP-2013]
MMMNLFSSFDPSSNWNTQINWLSMLIGMMFLPLSFWLIPSRSSILMIKMIMTIHNELKTLIGPNNKGHSLLFVSLLMLIMFNNYLGLFPYVFTATSHMTITLALALPLWTTFMLFGWLNHTKHMLAHLVPVGTPPILMPFMVCIETISNTIRPGTLAIRLMANMVAGHLLMTLLGNTGNMMSTMMISLLIFVQIMLLTLESAVALIQSYVFAVLSTLYSSEVN